MVQQSKKLRKTESKKRMCVDLCMSDSKDEVETTRKTNPKKIKVTVQSTERIKPGSRQPKATYIKQRCKMVIGCTVEEAMSKQVTDSKGQTVTYKQSDFNYDIQRKFLRLQEQTNENHTNERHDKVQQLLTEEYRQKWKRKKD